MKVPEPLGVNEPAHPTAGRWPVYLRRDVEPTENPPMSDLRTRLIRLAHSNPELRPHVLPLVAAKTAADTYSVADAAGLFDWMTKNVIRTARPYKLPVKAEVISRGDRGFEGRIRVGDDPAGREPFPRNLEVYLHVRPSTVGVKYDVSLKNSDGKTEAQHSEDNLRDFKTQSGRWILDDLSRNLSVDARVERELLAEQAMGRTAAWENLPEGWTEESVQSFWDNLTGDVKHKITKCMKQMEGKVTDTGAFCGSLASQVGYRAASAGTLDATTMRRAAIRVAHEDASVRGVILARMPR